MKFNLYEKVLNTYGTPAQITMMYEECGELINSLAKYQRGRASKYDVITELADVSIMIEQMAVLFGLDIYFKERDKKILRLKNSLPVPSSAPTPRA